MVDGSAVERLTEQEFDVVVSDLGMGAGMNGWELASTVRHRWPAVRFILATGWGAAIDPGEARAKGSRLSWPSRIGPSISRGHWRSTSPPECDSRRHAGNLACEIPGLARKE